MLEPNDDSSYTGKPPMVMVGAAVILLITVAFILTGFAATFRLYWEGLKLGWTWGGFF